MKPNAHIREAIDESLSGVRFDASNMHSVMRAVRSREESPVTRSRQRRVMRYDFTFAMAMLLILVLPIGLFAFHAHSTRTTSILAAPGAPTAVPEATVDLHADLIVSTAAPNFTAAESEAIRIARACFEAHCDTSIFTFEEYAVSVSASGSEYTVTMESIYGNGCRFVVITTPEDGQVKQYSTPRLATMPTYLDSGAPEIRAWYEKNGPYLFTWSPEAQAEFSRRYEGAALRTARAGEMSFDEAAQKACAHAAAAYGLSADALPYAYPVLYAERCEGAASYVVHCFSKPVTDTLPENGYIVTLNAQDGEVLSLSTY